MSSVSDEDHCSLHRELQISPFENSKNCLYNWNFKHMYLCDNLCLPDFEQLVAENWEADVVADWKSPLN